MGRSRRIAVMTGTRAEYGLLRGVMRRIQASKSLRLQVIVTGTHVSRQFGRTMDEILKDGFKIDSVIRLAPQEDSGLGMALSLGRSIKELASSLSRLRPDILVVLGDRFEVLAAALAATYLNIPIAHLHGGDISGSVDQPVRHATSKLCHIHFVASAQAGTQLRKIGEDKRRIFIVGAPGLDEILGKVFTSSDILGRKYDIDGSKPLLILLQHPVVTEEKKAVDQLMETLEAVKVIGIQTVVIYPNADAGGMGMIAAIKTFCRKNRFLKPVKSMPRTDFLGLMSVADAMIGNSSSALIEAPSFRLPVVNIGTRQLGRQRAGYVIDVDHDAGQIQLAIKNALRHGNLQAKRPRTSPYGDGRSSERIVRVLKDIDLNKFWPKR
jgi:UDP-N-acetylglucosamine 2-epimerase (non-hydrolysing)/GDP/UDP-N,N'-diacetylbacillosamine 2-epimerase (hydrolysing)